MDSQNLMNNFIKYLEAINIEFNVGCSQQLKNDISYLCVNYIEKISIDSSDLCETLSKNTLSEENFLFVLDKIGLNRYNVEISEERKRCLEENLRLENIYL